MATSTITGLSAVLASDLDDTATFPVDDNDGHTHKVTFAQARTQLQSNGQIVFPATQNPSANVNTLDDYEEGTWTPSIGGTSTYTTQVGMYIKIGKMVWVACYVVVNLKGTGSATVLGGLPFTVSSSPAINPTGSVSYFTALAVNVLFLSCYGNQGANSLSFTTVNAAAAASTDSPAIFGNGAGVILTAFYQATA